MANGLEEIGGIEELVDINTRQQRERDAILRDKENAQAEFDAYARDFSGEPLDMARVEAYKDKVEPWRFEQSLANLEDDYFKTEDKDQASRYTPILDKYLLDNPDAYVNLDAKNNRDIDIAWTEREESHHFPIFSGESREDLKHLSDDEYKMFAVAGYIAESEELDYENVVDNLEIYSAKYAAENGLTSPELDSVFSHISGNLTERKQARDNDRANWQRGVSSVLQGLSLNDALANSVNDKGGAITSAARAQFLGEYGSVLPQAKDIFDKFAAGTDRGARFAEKLEKYRDPIGILQGIGSAIETPKQQQEAIADLALMPREQRRKTLAVIWMMAEDQAGEMEAGGWGKLGESFMRGLDVYVENIDDAIDTSVEKLARDGGLTRIKREMRQDLRDVREIVSEIKSDNKFVQGVYDAARSTPYMLSAAVPYGGVLLNAASMATDNDIKLRRLYPDMSPEDRWRIASSAGVVQSAVERLSFKTWIKGFPSASQWVAGKGVAGKVGVLGLRGAGILVTENLEEAAQSATLPAMQALWGAFADDIPEVTDQDWEDSLFIYDEKTFFATLPLAILGAGGRTAYDMIGAAVSKDMLSDVDRVMLHGFSREEAQSIAGESSSLKQWLMFKDGSDAKSREERKELSESAVNDGALDRVVAKDEAEAFQKYEEEINKNGSEEDKVTLEVQKIARDYSQKYDAQVKQDGEQFKVEFPEVANRPTQTYETKDEADNALRAYQVEVGESYLETLSSASANIQAMTEQKKVLEEKQEGAKIKIGGKIVGLKEFAEKSDENMEQALERIEHELLKMGEIRPATKADLDKWRTRGQVKLKQDARGYVARLAKGANIADLVEEGSEGFLRDLIRNGFIEEKWVKGQILQYQELTGNRITTANSVEEMSYQQMVEAFSDMAVANFYNAHQQDVTGKIGSIINALRIFFAKVAKVAEDLLSIRDQIDADFQTLLDNAVGLDVDTRVDERIAEEQQRVEGDIDTFSISKADGGKPYKDRGGDEAGSPLTETEILEGIEDESGTLADIEVDDDAFSNDKGTTFSVAKKYPVIERASLAGKKKFVYFSDWTRVGVYQGLHKGSGINIDLQGGALYPYLEGHKGKAGWAFTTEGMFTRFQGRVDATDGIGLTTLYGKDNLRANPTFLMAYVEELKYALKAGLITENDMLSNLNKARTQVLGLSSKRTNKDTGEVKVKYTVSRESESFESFSQEWNSIEDFDSAMKSATFEIRGAMFSTSPKVVTKDGVKTKIKGQFSGGRLASQASVKSGMPDVIAMIDLFADPMFEGAEYGTIVGAIQFEKGQKKYSKAADIGAEEHFSYPVVIKGEGLGIFDSFVNVNDVVDNPKKKKGHQLTRSSETSMAGASFSIGRAEITPTANTQVFPTKDGGVVGEASFSISAFHGTPHKVDKFSTEQIGTGEGAQAYGWGLYFAESEGVAKGYRDTLSSSVDAELKDGTPLPAWVLRGHNDGRGDEIRAEFEDRKANAQKIIESKEGQHWLAHDVIATADRILKALDELDRGEVATQGRLYQVELNVEQDELLDWDKPLSEQSEQIQEFARSADVSVLKKGNRTRVMIEAWREGRDVGVLPTGRELYNAISDYRDGDIQAASQALHAAGIKGIKYLDGDSRGAGEGSYNYVTFNDADITIKTENGQEVDTTSFSISPAQDAAYMSAVESGNMETAQSMVDEAARKAGYDVNPYFHITPDLGLNRIKPRVFYLTTSKQDARNVAGKLFRGGTPTKLLTAYIPSNLNLKDVGDASSFLNQIPIEKQATLAETEGVDGFVGNMDGIPEIVIFKPEGKIKSADPVTYDADGNVIPLSQRFDPSRDEISFSLAPAEDTVMERITAMMRDPEAKMEVYRDMASRLRKVRERIYQKYIAYGKITDETMKESEREMDEREFIISSVAQMEAIANVLPPEVRSSLGTMKKLSTFKSGKGMRKYLTQRLDKVDSALEKYFRKELRKDVNDLIKRSQPKGRQKAADTGQSKIGVVGHEIAKAAKKAIKMSPEEAGLEAQKIRTKLDNIEEPTVDEIQENEDVAYVYELFADIANADSNRLTMMKQLLKTNWDEGRKQWQSVLQARKSWKEGKIRSIVSSLKLSGKSIAQKNRSGRVENLLRAAAREQISFYNLIDLLREGMKGEGFAVMGEMVDDLRRANNAFEWEQLQHKEEMRGVFARIFGITNINKTARVQARLNALAKEIEWGSKVTVSTMYDYHIQANAAELDEAYNKLQADPELDRIDIRDKVISRDEFDEMYIEYQNAIAEGFVPNDRNVFRHTINRNTGERASVGAMSQLDLLKDWLAVQQLDLKDKYDRAGHDEQYREELFEALDDDVKELGLWMQNKLREMTPETDRLHRSEYGLAMATIENYFPAVFEHKPSKEDTILQIDGIDVAGVSKRPSAHKMRVNHNSDPKRQNAINVFNHHIMQNAFWKTHAEVLRKWGSVLRSKEVQNAIKATTSQTFLKQLNKRIEDIETQGAAVAQVQIESDLLWRSIAKGMSLGILGMKLSTIFKNFSALTNVLLGVEAKYLIKGLRPEVFKNAKDLLESETFQRRLKMGSTVATRYALEGGKAGNIVFATTQRLAELGIQGINLADTGSNMTMSVAYTAKLVELRQEGLSDAEAKAQALDYVDDLMARYAQPTDRLSKSMLENSRTPLVSFLVMFQSEARKQMAINALAIRKLTTGKGVQSRSLAAQQLVVQVVMVNLFVHAVNAIYGALFKGYGEGDDAEEKFINEFTDKNKLASAMLAESFSGIPIAGELISGTIRKYFDQDVFSSSSNPLTRTIGTGSRQLLAVTSKWDERSVSENADAILRGIQMLGSVAPQTAFLSQSANVGRDALGFMNNALSQGFTMADTLDIYEKRIRKVVSSVNSDSAEEMKQAKEVKDFRMIRSIETQRRDEITSRAKEIFLEMSEEERQEFIKLQREKENGIQRYILREFLID